MPDKKFDLGDYVEVKDRIRVFYESYGQGRLVTSGYELTKEPDDKPKVIVTALAYRTADDPHPGVGTSWMYLPGSTSYTKGSEIENVETSAWGRAIGSLGILIDRSIATSNEIAGKADDRPAPEHLPPRDGSLIGMADVAKAPHDYEVRQTPDGLAIGFKLVEGRHNIRVVAYGALAEALAIVRDDVIGQRVTAYGVMSNETWTIQGKQVPYTRLVLSRIETPTVILPSTVALSSLPLGLDLEADLDAAGL